MSGDQPVPPPVTGPVSETDRPRRQSPLIPAVPQRPPPPAPVGPPAAVTAEPSGFGYLPPPQYAPAVPSAAGYRPPPLLPVAWPANQPVRYDLPPKETGIAYLFLLLLGGFGAHQFYLGRPGRGILYILTLGGFLGILPLVDLFTLPGQVRRVNTERAVLGR